MTNYEKYKDEIIKELVLGSNCHVRKKYVLKSDDCSSLGCSACKKLTLEWLEAEYVEPTVDWSNVEVDTSILVGTKEDDCVHKRHFAKLDDGTVCAWNDGKTSFTSNGHCTPWPCAKLAEVE